MADQDLQFNIAMNSEKRNEQQNPNSNPQRENKNNINNSNNQANNHQNRNEAQNNRDEVTMSNFISKASNPMICIFTIIFKIGAIASFILLDIFVSNEAIAYLVVIILSAADFWTTKNISGRILVGLRWWNEVKENGEEVWIFESKNEKKGNGVDTNVFWMSLYINFGGWLALFLWETIRLKFVWAIVALICLVFAGTNLYGFMKCSKDQQAKVTKFGASAVLRIAERGVDAAKNQA